MSAYGVNVGKHEAVVGFRSPRSRDVGKDDNVVRDGEVRIADLLFAVLGMPSPMQEKWIGPTAYASASFIASKIPKGRVFELNMAEEKSMVSTPTKGKKTMRSKTKHGAAKKGSPARKAKKQDEGKGRICSVCTKRGHNARSHRPGGRLA